MMKFASMNSRDRRAITLGALILVPGAVLPMVVKPYLNALASVHARTSDERSRLAAERRVITTLPTFPATLDSVSQKVNIELNRLFQSNDELVATGDLAQYVAGAAQDNGVRLQQSETRPAQPVAPGVQALQLAINAEGDLSGILHFVHQLESGGKLVRFDALSIDGGRGPFDTPTSMLGSPRRPMGAPEEQGISDPRHLLDDGPSMSLGSFGGASVSSVPEEQGISDPRHLLDDGPPMSSGRASASDAGRAQGAEVLSLHASVYGYRLSDSRWASVNTNGKTAPSPFLSAPTYAFQSLNSIVDHDPFNAQRTRPAISYQEAMEQKAHPALPAKQIAPSQQARQRQQRNLRLLGTVAYSSNPFVMCQSGNTTPSIVYVGEQIDGYTLASVQRGSAVFKSFSGEELRLRTDPVGQSPADGGNNRGHRRGGRNGDDQSQNAQNDNDEPQNDTDAGDQQVQQLLQALNNGGQTQLSGLGGPSSIGPGDPNVR